MADTSVKIINVETQSEVEVLYKDVGSSQHVPGMMPVGGDGKALVGPGAPQAPTEVAISTTVLRCGGATSWTGANANTALRRTANITNLSVSSYAYFTRIATGDSTVGAVSSTSYDFALAPGASLRGIELKGGYDLAVVRAATSTDKVRYGEELPS